MEEKRKEKKKRIKLGQLYETHALPNRVMFGAAGHHSPAAPLPFTHSMFFFAFRSR